MNNYRLNVIEETNRDIIKAVKLLTNLDHNFYHQDGMAQYFQIVKSCRQILETVSEELVQIVAKGDKKND